MGATFFADYFSKLAINQRVTIYMQILSHLQLLSHPFFNFL